MKIIQIIPAAIFFVMLSSFYSFSSKASDNNPTKTGGITYLQVDIDQPNVYACYQTSVNDMELENKIQIYPNPNQGVFTLELGLLKGNEEVRLRAYNLNGSKVFETTELATEESMKLQLKWDNLPKGVYILHIRIEERIYTRNIIFM